MQREEAVYNHDFLDSIDEDLPNNAWGAIRDLTGTVATLRNELWPGYFAFHKVRTPIYGSVYIGDGIRCNDLPFMI